MVKHGMTVIQQVVHKVNPGQIPATIADQLVYVLFKQIQSKFSNDFVVDALIIMIGGLHIEIAMLTF